MNKYYPAKLICFRSLRVENNFDLDEMDESLKKRRKKDNLHLKADFELCCH